MVPRGGVPLSYRSCREGSTSEGTTDSTQRNILSQRMSEWFEITAHDRQVLRRRCWKSSSNAREQCIDNGLNILVRHQWIERQGQFTIGQFLRV